MTDSAPQYREIAPTGILAAHLRCIWRLSGYVDATAAEPIIPDGCAEIVVNVGEPFVEQASDGSVTRQPARLVAGQITRALTVGPSGRIDIWGVRFHPWSAAAFLGVSGDELRDRVESLDAVASALDSALKAIECADDRDSVRENVLTAALAKHAATLPRVHPLARRLVDAASRSRTDLSVRGLAKSAGLGTRRVQAVFRDQVGLSPKQLLRINRFQRALALARSQSSLSWSAIALCAGYYDHAHLLHDSREIAGMTPSQLLGRDASLTELFLSG